MSLNTDFIPFDYNIPCIISLCVAKLDNWQRYVKATDTEQEPKSIFVMTARIVAIVCDDVCDFYYKHKTKT